MEVDNRLYRLLILVGVFITFILLIGLTPATAAEEAYYKGKVLTIMTESSPGAGSDMTARMIARHLPRFLPGKPNGVVRNVTAAAGIQCPNYVYKKAKPDGLTMMVGSLQALSSNIFRPPGVEYRYEEMPCLFGYLAGNVLVIKPQVATKPADLMKAKGLIFGGISPSGSSNGLLFVFAKELIGFPVEKAIWGYTTAQARMAFLSGETTAFAESILGYRQALEGFAKKGEIVPILQGGILNTKGEVVRDPVGPDVPTIPELYKEVHGQSPSGELWEACKLIFIGSRAFSKYLIYPPKTPEKIVAIGRKAIREMMQDKEFKKESDNLSPGEYILTEDAPGLWEKVCAPSPQVVKYAKQMFTEKWGVVWE